MSGAPGRTPWGPPGTRNARFVNTALRPIERVTGVSAGSLRAGIEWLAQAQGPEAQASHFWIMRELGPYKVSVSPNAPHSAPEATAVVIFELREEARIYDVGGRRLTNGVGPEERARLEQILAALVPVIDRWNGEQLTNTTCSFAVKAEVSAEL